MASRKRPSAGSTVIPTPRHTAPASELPPYESPAHPLNDAAQHGLASLYNRLSTAKLKDHYHHASKMLEESAGEINDRLTDKRILLEKRKTRRARENKDDAQADEDEAKELSSIRERVEGMTKRMDAGIRKAIDGQAGVTSVESALRQIQGNARASSISATQMTSTQRSRADVNGSSDDDPDPTNPSSTVVLPSLVPGFQDSLEKHVDKYQSLPQRTRYADHTSYANFKRVVHDAQHPEDQPPPLPHPSTWFNPAGGARPAYGVTSTAADGEDDDDDIAVARERISTRCPLTLLEFKEPVTSTKCPHSFEKDAINGLILTAGGIAKCPVCEKPLGFADLCADAVLIRKIKRIQRAREREAEEAEEDGMDGRPGTGATADEIESDSADDIDAVERRPRTPAPRVKGENKRRKTQDDIEDD